MPRLRIPRFTPGRSDVERWIRDFIREMEDHDQIHMHREADLRRTIELQDGEGRGFFFQQIKPFTRIVSMSGASVTLVGVIPPSIVYGVFTRVNTAITGATGFDVGTPANLDAWGNNLAVAAKSVSNFAHFTDTTIRIFTAAEDVVLTAVGPNFSGGEVEVTLYYSDFVN